MSSRRTLLDRVMRRERATRPHLLYLAIGFPPAAKSSAYRLRETANQFCASGWDVTVVTIRDEAWERDYGLDYSLCDGVDPRVDVVRLPLARVDLETDIRAYSEERSLRPHQWVAQYRKQVQESFPEPVFGGWRSALERALLQIHRRKPANLLLTTCAPYVGLAATWRLWREKRVPYAIDFRDGWSVDVIGGGEAFSRDSVAGRWEARVLSHAISIWCVNEPIAQFYRQRYPELADRVITVRNGYDPDSIPAQVRQPNPEEGLTFGYLGVMNLPLPLLDATLAGWRLARATDPILARSRFEVRGHVGAAWAREDNPHMERLKAAAADGVVFEGPVRKADVAAVYARWDALVLLVTGGHFMTSGKVYEYMATGLPIVSAHEADHDAATVLSDYPLWTGVGDLTPERLAESFRLAAKLATTTTSAERASARDVVRKYARDAAMAPAVRQLISIVEAESVAVVGGHPR